MTTPEDPFAKPDGRSETGPGAPPGYGPPTSGSTPVGGPPPGYGAPPAGYGPPPAGYGRPFGYGPPAEYGPGSGRPELASWGRRAVGYLIDGVIGGAIDRGATSISASLGQIVSIIVLLVFGYLTGTTGQTPGRRVMGTSVRRDSDGQFIGIGTGIGREILHILDFLPLLLGFLWPIWDKKNQTFADKIVKSVVIKV